MITPAEADRQADVVGRVHTPVGGAPLARGYLRRNQERRRQRVWWVRLAWLATAFGAGLGIVGSQFMPFWLPPVVAAAGVTAYLYVLERVGLYAPRA